MGKIEISEGNQHHEPNKNDKTKKHEVEVMVKGCEGGWLRLAEELVSDMHEGRLGHVLGENVGHVVSCWGVFQLQFRCFDEVPDEMMTRLAVLGPLVGD